MGAETEGQDVYGLGRDLKEYVRLNAQHAIWISSLGYHIHPDIVEAVKDKPDLRIADVATGSGIFIYDLAQTGTFPASTQYDGFDISNEQFPADKEGGNVKLHMLDMLQPDIPAEWKNIFDVVHIRLVVLAFPDGDPAPLLRNVYSMLKPGGYIQWEEYDCTGPIVQPPNVQSEATDFLMNLAMVNIASRWGSSWIDRFPADMSACGFSNVQHIVRKVTGDFNQRYMSMMLLMASESMAELTSRAPDEESRRRGENMKEKIPIANKEVKNGALLIRDLRIWTAKKGQKESDSSETK